MPLALRGDKRGRQFLPSPSPPEPIPVRRKKGRGEAKAIGLLFSSAFSSSNPPKKLCRATLSAYRVPQRVRNRGRERCSAPTVSRFVNSLRLIRTKVGIREERSNEASVASR